MSQLLINNIVELQKKIKVKDNGKTLLFIADISGFTRFVNETEINHSSHIISELLEIIIEKNRLGLKVAEIEGDAVFFYKEGKIPKVSEIMEQVNSMFTAFHEHLLIYERDRICQCGACISASNLGLKFVNHKGEVIIRNIKGNLQLMGKDVTLGHKLLKNDVNSNEYALFTDAFEISTSSSTEQSFRESSSYYDDIGDVKYMYMELKDVLKQINVPSVERTRKKRVKNPIEKKLMIDNPIEKVHEVLIDLNVRSQWKTEVVFDEKKIERIGTAHECIVPQGSVIGYVVDNIVKEDEIIYEEYTDRFNALFPAISEVFHLKPIAQNRTELCAEFHVHAPLLLRVFWRSLLKIGVGKGLKKFKALAESR